MAATDLERQLQAIVAALAIAILLWVGNTLLEIKKETIVLRVQLDAIQEQMIKMQQELEANRRRHEGRLDKFNGS